MPEMQKNIFLDLDGTLLDVGQRLYGLFMELVPEASFTYDEYWKIKRARTNQNDLLGKHFNYAPEKITSFKKSWLEKVEEEARLALDTPFEKTGDFLSEIAQNHNLYVVTARQNPSFVSQQLQRLGWSEYFKQVLVTQQASSKADLIRKAVTVNATDIFVGDTGEDIATAKELGTISVAVCSGFLSREILQEYKPDYLINSLTDLHETRLLQP